MNEGYEAYITYIMKHKGFESQFVKTNILLRSVYTERILLHENLDDSCGNYRSDYLVDAAVSLLFIIVVCVIIYHCIYL